MTASLTGVRYHLVISLTLASIREMFWIPLKDLVCASCQVSISLQHWKSASQAFMYEVLSVGQVRAEYSSKIPPLCSMAWPHHSSYAVNLGGSFSFQIVCRKWVIWWKRNLSESGRSRFLIQKLKVSGLLEVKKCPIRYSPLSSHHLNAEMSNPGANLGLWKRCARGRPVETRAGECLRLPNKAQK